MPGFVRPVRAVKPSSVKKPSMRFNQPGGRHGTTLAQRNASRRNIQKALMARRARSIE